MVVFFPVEFCSLQLLLVMTMQDHEANAGGESKEFISAVGFLAFF